MFLSLMQKGEIVGTNSCLLLVKTLIHIIMVTEICNVHRVISSCDVKLVLTEWWDDSVSTEWHCIYRVSSVYRVQNYIEWLVWTKPLLLLSAWWCQVMQWMSSMKKSPSELLEPKFLHLGQLSNIGVNLCFGQPFNYEN